MTDNTVHNKLSDGTAQNILSDGTAQNILSAGTAQTMYDKYILSNGSRMLPIGFGTYNPGSADSEEMIKMAIDAGYRYFDTASLYGTERALGNAIRERGIPREEFYIASKLWIDEMGYEETMAAFERTLARLQTDYLDLYLIHWPRKDEEDTDWKARGIDTWRAMEELHAQGRIRNLGLSNFLPHHMEVILTNCKVKPVVNQLEVHPGYMQEAAIAYCRENDVLVQAWSPLGRGQLLSHPFVTGLAGKYGKSAAQVVLRYLIQRGIVPLVKASGAERMRQNLDVFDFEITGEDMSMLTCLPQVAWSGEHPDYSIPKARSNPEV